MRVQGMRKEDSSAETYERSERFYHSERGWYFTVRQGAAFGPYESRQNAEKNLHSFVSLLINN